MKHQLRIFHILSIVALTCGCNKEPTASEQMDKVKTETKAVTDDMKDYTFARKSEFVAKMQAQLETLSKDLDQLSAKIEKSSDAVKAEAKPQLQGLRDQARQLNLQLGNVRNATDSTWESVKTASQKSLDSVKAGFQKSRQWVSDKIAP